MKCSKCKFWSVYEQKVVIHESRWHKNNFTFPDFVGMGIMKRKLTRKEANNITKEVMQMELKSSEARFQMAIIQAIDCVGGAE